ncbi:MAG: sigma-70 family RNA polymerase sigma factor [Geodermatophilaceae bacterium]
MPSKQLQADDSVLVRWAQDGHSEAFEQLVRRHRVRVYRTALRLTGDAHTADDVAQDAFIAAWRSLRLFRAESSFTTWLYRIVVNQATNSLRSRRDEPVDEVPVEGFHPGADTEAIAREGSQRVLSAIVELPFEQRTAFVLRLFEDLTYEEVAQVLSISPDAVRGRLHRARNQLTKTLGGER